MTKLYLQRDAIEGEDLNERPEFFCRQDRRPVVYTEHEVKQLTYRGLGEFVELEPFLKAPELVTSEDTVF